MPKKWEPMSFPYQLDAKEIESMTCAEAAYVRERFRKSSGYAELALAFPNLGGVLDELPDISNVFKLLHEIKVMMADAVCEFRGLRYGSLKF